MQVANKVYRATTKIDKDLTSKLRKLGYQVYCMPSYTTEIRMYASKSDEIIEVVDKTVTGCLRHIIAMIEEDW